MLNGSYLAHNQSKISFGINIPQKKNTALKRRITKEKHMDKKCVLCGRRTNLELHPGVVRSKIARRRTALPALDEI